MTRPLPAVQPAPHPPGRPGGRRRLGRDARVALTTLAAAGPVAVVVVALAVHASWTDYAAGIGAQGPRTQVVGSVPAPSSAPLAAPLPVPEPVLRDARPETGVREAPGASQPRTVLTTEASAPEPAPTAVAPTPEPDIRATESTSPPTTPSEPEPSTTPAAPPSTRQTPPPSPSYARPAPATPPRP